MNKRSLALLEKAFAAEVDSALTGSPGLMQTQSTKLAEQLVIDGYLKKCEERIGMVVIRGYCLTLIGHLAYCTSVDDILIDNE